MTSFKHKNKVFLETLFSHKQMSEAFCNSAFLALSGGFQDAYTYNTRGGVFSNAQTGNIVLMTQHLMLGEWQRGVRYLLPLLSFALGVFIAERIQYNYKYVKGLHWRQRIILIEVVILGGVGIIPIQFKVIPTVLVSFACALQVQAFRKVRGYSYASTMCIGNLRSGTVALSNYFREKGQEQLQEALYYWGIIFLFAIGAGIGGVISTRYGTLTIWISCIFLSISFFLMFIEEL